MSTAPASGQVQVVICFALLDAFFDLRRIRAQFVISARQAVQNAQRPGMLYEAQQNSSQTGLLETLLGSLQSGCAASRHLIL